MSSNHRRDHIIERIGALSPRLPLLRLVLPSAELLKLLVSYGLPQEHVDRIRYEISLWHLPMIVTTPIIVILNLWLISAPSPEQPQVVSVERELIRLAFFAVGLALSFTLAATLRWLPVKSASRRLIRDVVLCAEALAITQERNERLTAREQWGSNTTGREKARITIRNKSRSVVKQLVARSARDDRDRSRSPLNDFALWMHWAAEDLGDRRRVDGAWYACVDMLRFAFTPIPCKAPRLQAPPPSARVSKPTRFHALLFNPRATSYAIPVLSLIAAVLTFLAKVLP